MSSVAFVLAQVDAGQAISVAKDLGAASPQQILSYFAVGATLAAAALGVMLYRSWQAHLAEVKSCSSEKQQMMEAILDFKEVVKAALDVVKSK